MAPVRCSSQAENPFAGLIDWMQNNLDRPLHVPALAARAGLGERNFYRRFFAATGSSPAHFVEALRLEAARTLVDGDLPLKGVAARVGLTPIRLNNAFERRFGVAPRLFRDMHRTAGAVPIGITRSEDQPCGWYLLSVHPKSRRKGLRMGQRKGASQPEQARYRLSNGCESFPESVCDRV